MNQLKVKHPSSKMDIIKTEKTFKRFKFCVERATDTDSTFRQMINKHLFKNTIESSFMFDEKDELYYNTLDDAIKAIKTIISSLCGRWAYLKIIEVIVEDKLIEINKKTKVKRFYTKILKYEYTYIISQYKPVMNKVKSNKDGRPKKNTKL